MSKKLTSRALYDNSTPVFAAVHAGNTRSTNERFAPVSSYKFVSLFIDEGSIKIFCVSCQQETNHLITQCQPVSAHQFTQAQSMVTMGAIEMTPSSWNATQPRHHLQSLEPTPTQESIRERMPNKLTAPSSGQFPSYSKPQRQTRWVEQPSVMSLDEEYEIDGAPNQSIKNKNVPHRVNTIRKPPQPNKSRGHQVTFSRPPLKQQVHYMPPNSKQVLPANHRKLVTRQDASSGAPDISQSRVGRKNPTSSNRIRSTEALPHSALSQATARAAVKQITKESDSEGAQGSESDSEDSILCRSKLDINLLAELILEVHNRITDKDRIKGRKIH